MDAVTLNFQKCRWTIIIVRKNSHIHYFPVYIHNTQTTLNIQVVQDVCIPFFAAYWSKFMIVLTLYAPCIILQYLYKPTRCTKFL